MELPNKPQFLDQIFGVIPTVDTAPTHIPTKFSDQFRIYKSGSTYRFYWYDATNAEWRYATGT